MHDIVFITGGSGFLGLRIIVEALHKGYKLRVAVRSESKAAQIRAAPSVKPYLEEFIDFIIVPDILTPAAYDKALDGVSHIIHAASPLAQETDDYDRDVIQPAIQGTLGILQSALKYPSIKRVVITSSVAVLVSYNDFMVEDTDKTFDAKSTAETPSGPYPNAFAAYGASKILALQATKKFMAEKKPHFDVVNILPSFIIGKNELVTDPKHITDGTNGIAFGQVLGKDNPAPTPGTSVHLNDVALIHVLAMEKQVPAQDYVVSGEGVKGTVWSDALDYVKKHFPEEVKNGVLPLGGKALTKKVKVDSSKTEEAFNMKLKGYEEQVLSVTRHYLKLVKR